MFCKNCGKEISENTKFCPECGVSQIADGKIEEAVNSISAGFDFHNWIMENSLESYEEILKSEDFDTEDILIGIKETDLDKLDLLSAGAKKKILNAVQKLKSTEDTYTAKKELTGKEGIPNRCPKCGEIWGMAKENSGAGNTLGKALVGGLLLGPLGVIGGAAFGNKTTVYICNKCGFKKE